MKIKYIYISNFELGCQTKTLKHLSKKIKFLFFLFNFSIFVDDKNELNGELKILLLITYLMCTLHCN